MLGFWFGFGHHVAGLYWLAWPMTLDLARFGWMIPFAVFGLSGLLALFIGASTLAAHVAGGRGIRQIVYLAVAWAVFEWLRGFILTGFPWNLLATSWVALDMPAQAASAIGPYGLSLVTVLIAALPATWWIRRPGRRPALAACLTLLVVLFAFGWLRLPAGDAAVLRDVRVRIVQGHVPQSLKWASSETGAVLQSLYRAIPAAGLRARHPRRLAGNRHPLPLPDRGCASSPSTADVCAGSGARSPGAAI